MRVIFFLYVYKVVSMLLWYYAMHTDNQSVGQYLFHVIVHNFIIEKSKEDG